jgi:hypothetical protein
MPSHGDDHSSESKGSKEIHMKEASGEPEFVVSTGLTSQEAAVLLQKWGRNELPEKITPKVRISSS